MVMQDVSNRHPSVQSLYQYFTYEHLKTPLRGVSAECAQLADSMIAQLPDSPELTAGLRKLLEAKDCFVRTALDTAQVNYTDR